MRERAAERVRAIRVEKGEHGNLARSEVRQVLEPAGSIQKERIRSRLYPLQLIRAGRGGPLPRRSSLCAPEKSYESKIAAGK